MDCKGWLEGLDRLVVGLTGRDPGEFGEEELVFGSGEDGPWLTRWPREIVAALAGVEDDRLRAYADDELLDDDEIERYAALRDLARSAITVGREVYCWSSP